LLLFNLSSLFYARAPIWRSSKKKEWRSRVPGARSPCTEVCVSPVAGGLDRLTRKKPKKLRTKILHSHTSFHHYVVLFPYPPPHATWHI
jgi:hypothetical protein